MSYLILIKTIPYTDNKPAVSHDYFLTYVSHLPDDDRSLEALQSLISSFNNQHTHRTFLSYEDLTDDAYDDDVFKKVIFIPKKITDTFMNQ